MSLFDDDAFNDRLFFPRRDQRAPADADDVFVAVSGANLHLRVHTPRPSARALVLLFHGNGEVVADYDDAKDAFADAGCALAVVDYRGYGASSGVPTLRDALEDTAAVVDVAARHAAGRDLPLVVMGRSLGSLCAAVVCGNNESSAVQAIIIESGIGHLSGLVARRGYPTQTAFSPADTADFDPLPKMRRGRRPLLVLHGEEDEIIDIAEADAVFAAAGTVDKTMIRIVGRGHNDISFSPSYWEALRSFIARVSG